MRYYAGIGSRETPLAVCDRMFRFARSLRARDWHLRTGGAKGADQNFELGAPPSYNEHGMLQFHRTVYLPFWKYNQYGHSPEHRNAGEWEWTKQIAAGQYGLYKYRYASGTVQALMNRNVAIILGGDENGYDPEKLSEFVVCWTPEGGDYGGTAHGIKVARHYGIPVYNFAIEGDVEALWQRIK